MRSGLRVRQAGRVRSRVLNRTLQATVGGVAAAALLAACAGGADQRSSGRTAAQAPPAATAAELTDVEVADVTVAVPVGWERRSSDTDGFAAYSWLSPRADDGTRVAVQVDVACSGGGSAVDGMDAYLSASPLDEFRVLEREDVDPHGGATAQRLTAAYSIPVASSGVSTRVARHALLVADDGVAALVVVEGVSTRVDDAFVAAVFDGVVFGAATDERVAACQALTDG